MSSETGMKIEKTIRNMLDAFNERDTELTLTYFYFDENFLSYGLDGSKTTSREQYRQLLENDFNKLVAKQIEIVWHKISIYRTMATFVCECSMQFSGFGDQAPVPIRFTAVLREINDRWKINQLCFSSDVLTQAA